MTVFVNPIAQLYMAFIGPKLYKSMFMLGFMHVVTMLPFQGPLFLYGSGYFKNFKHEEGVKNFYEKGMQALVFSLPYWFATNIPIYMYFSYHFRMPVMNVTSYIFSIVLSYINNTTTFDKK